MTFKDSYPEYIAIEKQVRRARVERSLAIALMIADAAEIGIRGLKKLARTLGAKRAGALPQWARHVSAEN
jgi:hypothetical protein